MTVPAAGKDWRIETQTVADSIRRRVLDHVLRNNGGYYGSDVALLIGGDLHRGDSLVKNAAAFREPVEE